LKNGKILDFKDFQGRVELPYILTQSQLLLQQKSSTATPRCTSRMSNNRNFNAADDCYSWCTVQDY